MKQYKVYYRNELLYETYFREEEIYIGSRYTADREVGNRELDLVEWIITTIKEDRIWVHRYDNWLQKERVRKLNQLGL